jgi:hypothetical protein
MPDYETAQNKGFWTVGDRDFDNIFSIATRHTALDWQKKTLEKIISMEFSYIFRPFWQKSFYMSNIFENCPFERWNFFLKIGRNGY